MLTSYINTKLYYICVSILDISHDVTKCRAIFLIHTVYYTILGLMTVVFEHQIVSVLFFRRLNIILKMSPTAEDETHGQLAR